MCRCTGAKWNMTNICSIVLNLKWCSSPSFTSQSFGASSSLKGQTSWRGEKGCGSYFVREMLHLFSDEKMDNKIQAMYNKIKKERKEIAFTAGISKDETYSNQAVLRFNKVITNIGGGLNAKDGVFYCPEPGVYSFFVNIMSNTNAAYVQIQKNDKFIMHVHTEHGGSSWKTGSNQVILQLKKGDKVSVKSHSSVRVHPHTTHFSGNKL